MGYLAMSVLTSVHADGDGEDYQADLESAKETDVCLALVAISSLTNPEYLMDDVAGVLKKNDTSCFVRKKACLCLLSIIRKGQAQGPQKPVILAKEVKYEEVVAKRLEKVRDLAGMWRD